MAQVDPAGTSGPAAAVEGAVGLGSNLGDRLAHLVEARRQIGALPGTSVLASSPVYETEPVDVAEAYRELTFLNACLLVRTVLPLERWSEALHAIEDRMLRERTGDPNAPRTIDIDLLSYGEVRSTDPRFRLPHPRSLNRRFVCQPLHDLRPGWVLPGQPYSVTEALRRLPPAPRVWRHCDDW